MTTPPGPGLATRADWAALADRLLRAVRPYASPGGARIVLPGAPGGYGTDVDGLEGYARTLLLAGFRLAGERGADPLGLVERYAAGLAAGTDPASPERWPRPSEHGQAKVEAASIALVLDLTRPWLWDRLDARVQERVVDYLAEVVGDDTYPPNNWLWFRVVVETFLASVGGPWSTDDVAADLARHDALYRGAGWYSDGPERAYDHYVGWAMHLYPTLWARMRGAGRLADRGTLDRDRLDAYLRDAVRLVGADGGPLVQGRSLTYRFATAAPLWAGALARVPGTPAGLLRTAAGAVVGHFAARGAPDRRDLLTLGWFGPWRPLAQGYSGPGSPYWAVKGLLGLALPADDPVWTDPAVDLPDDPEPAALAAPGWLVTRWGGVARVTNHGTDHAREGDVLADSPLYARLGYSTATAPDLAPDAWADPVDQSVVLLDAQGHASHRTGLRALGVRTAAVVGPEGSAPLGAGIGASTWRAHWVEPVPVHDLGHPRPGAARPAGGLTVVSVVRGPWEVRFVRVDAVVPAVVALRVGGWALAGAVDALSSSVGERRDLGRAPAPHASVVVHGMQRADLVALALEGPDQRGVRRTAHAFAAWDEAGHLERADASPLGPRTVVPWLRAHAPRAGQWRAVAVGLHVLGAGAAPRDRAVPALAAGPDGGLEVRWWDGTATGVVLPGIEEHA